MKSQNIYPCYPYIIVVAVVKLPHLDELILSHSAQRNLYITEISS